MKYIKNKQKVIPSAQSSRFMRGLGKVDVGKPYSQRLLPNLEPEFYYFLDEALATAPRAILHKYANEDVSLGSWFIGLEVEHIDDRNMCCGTPPDCEWKAQAGNVCIASFDWSCSGICKSVEKIKDVHARCGEGDGAVWSALF